MPLAIAFPMFDPVAVEIGPVAIRWYALAYIAGIVIGWWYIVRLASRPGLWGARDHPGRAAIDDWVFWATLGVIFGGRLGYVLFYDLAAYMAEPMAILRLWEGGMSFHGGLVGVVVATFLVARKHGLPTLALGDLAAAAAPVGLFLGRLANFLNGELWGRPTDLPWGFVYPPLGPEPRHPSQLYEAGLEGLLLFIVLAVLIYRFQALKWEGRVTGVFLAVYALSRIAVETVRTPDPQIGFLWGGLTMGMLLSLPMALIGLWLIWRSRTK
ncbi:MAG: prolipoprotein diacylglyceryl transferase [Flavobacteriaceae bacterium]